MARLAGIFGRQPTADLQSELASMVACMLHEPFYRSRTFVVPSLGCCVALVSHDPSFADCSLAVSADRTVAILIAGELFMAEADCTPEALLAAYESTGDRFLLGLNGSFSGVVLDTRRDCALLFNDRLGLGRVYHASDRDSFAFSSEAKSLLAVRPGARRLNPTALGQYCGAGAVLGDLTLFDGVFTMPGGSAWSVGRAGEVTKGRYFDAADLEQQDPLSSEAFYESLRDTLTRVVPRYFRRAEQTAVSLTGGLDTRTVMAFAPPVSSGRAYTYGGMYRESLDVRVARQVAHACGYRHDVVPIDRMFFDTFPDLATQTIWTTDGTADIGVSHEIHLSRAGKAIAPIRITGNYGSELLRGVSLFKPLHLAREAFSQEFAPYLDEGVRTLARARDAHPISFTLFEEIARNLYGRLAAAQSQVTVRSPFTDNEIVALAYRRPRPAATGRRLWNRLIAEQKAVLATLPTDRTPAPGVNPVARHLDRLVKYLTFKAEWYYEGGMPDCAGRIDAALYRGRTPPRFAGTHKIESYRRWFRDELHPWVTTILCQPPGERWYVHRPGVVSLVERHGKGAGNFTKEIFRLSAVELIQRTMFAESSYSRRSLTAEKPIADEMLAVPGVLERRSLIQIL